MKKKFWKLENAVDGSGSTLHLEGPISQESWWGDEVTPQEFRDELKNVTGNKLTVIINSTGGDVWAGISIHDALKEFEGEVTVKVSGLAASIASVIAMAGDKIVMTPGSTMMIHRASMVAFGSADDMKKAIEMLETVEDGIISIYADRTGSTKETVKEMLDAETWMSAEKAVELGFADAVIKPKSQDEEETAQNAFNGNFAFSMSATKASLESFVRKVTASNEEEVADVITDAEQVDDTEGDLDESESEVETEAGEVTEAPATEVGSVDNKIKETEKVNMKPKNAKQDEAAAEGVVSNTLPKHNEAPKQTVKDYLKTKASMEAFAKVLEQQAGGTSEDVRNAWVQHLEVTMGVTNPEIFLPEALITEIEDAFKEGGEIWNRVTKTGADVWKAAWDAATDPDAEAGRASGYRRSEQEDKREQTLTFAARILRPQFVYKYITLNKEDVKNQQSTGALVRFVLAELPRRIVREVERAIVLGDGRADNDDYKIVEGDPQGFFPIVADVEDEGVFASLYVPEEGESRAEAVAKAMDLVEATGTMILIAKKGYATAARFEKDADGKLLFPLGTKASDVFDVDTIIQPDWFNDTTSPDVDAVVVALSNYRVVGDTSIEAFTNFILKKNKQEYLQEIYCGGGLTVRKAAVGIAAPSES